jgi:hypothetical protein
MADKCDCNFCTSLYPALRWLKENAPKEHYEAISTAIDALEAIETEKQMRKEKKNGV